MHRSAALLLATALPAGAAEPAAEAEPDPIAIASAAAEFLAAQPAFAFSWFVSYDLVVEGREKLTFLRSGRTVMDRAAGFVSETERGADRRDYYYDGESFTVAAPEDGFYATAPFADGFDALVAAVRARTGTVVPLWSIMSERLPAAFLAGVDGAAYVGLTRIAGQPAHHIAFTSYDEDWQVWIADDPEAPLPLMLVGTEPHIKGWPQYRAYLMDWDLAPEIAEGMFTHVPEEDAMAVSFPELVSLPEAAPEARADGAPEAPAEDAAQAAEDAPEPAGEAREDAQ